MLVNGVVRETRERLNRFFDVHLGFRDTARLGQAQHRVNDAAQFALRLQLGHNRRVSKPDGPSLYILLAHSSEKAVPIFTLRKRAGAAPCPVPMVCMGWPLPQLGVPHKTQWSAEQMASHEFQNSVVIPL